MTMTMWDGACRAPCPRGLGDPEGHTPQGPLMFSFPTGEWAGGTGQVRGQRGRLGGRWAVPLRGQPRLLNPGRVAHRPRPLPWPPPRHCSHPASTPATQGSRHMGRGRGLRPVGQPHAAVFADEVGGPGYPAPEGSHPGAPLVGGSGQAMGRQAWLLWGAGGEA